MAFCSKCGAQLAEETKFCPACGAAVEDSQNSSQETAQQETTKENNKQTNFGEKVANLNNTADTTSEYDNDDITKNKAMAILSYLGILVLIPIFAAKDSKFARYHANQGLVLLITEVAYSIVNAILTAILGAIFPINWWTLSHGAVYGLSLIHISEPTRQY